MIFHRGVCVLEFSPSYTMTTGCFSLLKFLSPAGELNSLRSHTERRVCGTRSSSTSSSTADVPDIRAHLKSCSSAGKRVGSMETCRCHLGPSVGYKTPLPIMHQRLECVGVLCFLMLQTPTQASHSDSGLWREAFLLRHLIE